MTYQEYIKLTNKLTSQKDALYDIASHKLSNGDKAGATRIYSEIDEIQKELDALVNPNDSLIGEDEDLFNFDN